MRKTIFSLFVCLVGVACTPATNFYGEAHVPGGPAGCMDKCRSWNLEFAGMIAMGEYSDGCICRVPRPAGTAASVEHEDDAAVAGASAAAAGVVTAMRARQQQAQQTQVMRH